MYVKTADETKIDVIDLDFYCKCPICGREVAVPEFFEYFENKNFDLYGSRVYCDSCTKDSEIMHGVMKHLVSAEKLDSVVITTLKSLHDGITA